MRTKPTIDGWGKRRGKPWEDIDIQCALFLRHCGLTNDDIAAILRRSKQSIDGKIGYRGSGVYYSRFEAARRANARALGNAADSYIHQTAGSA